MCASESIKEQIKMQAVRMVIRRHTIIPYRRRSTVVSRALLLECRTAGTAGRHCDNTRQVRRCLTCLKQRAHVLYKKDQLHTKGIHTRPGASRVTWFPLLIITADASEHLHRPREPLRPNTSALASRPKCATRDNNEDLWKESKSGRGLGGAGPTINNAPAPSVGPLIRSS
jgi:hypothetical protein